MCVCVCAQVKVLPCEAEPAMVPLTIDTTCEFELLEN